jgi:hypothetical protein
MPNIMTESTEEITMDKQQGKRVSFYGRVKCRKLPYLQPEEILNAWYLPEDFVAAREYERVLRTYISQNRELHLKNEENICALGLRTDIEKRTKIRAIRASIRAVLTEQHRQEDQFLDATQNDDNAIFYLSDQKISSIYSLHAQESSRQALSRGLRHARHVKDITLETSFREPDFNTIQESPNDMNSENTAHCEAESLIVFDDAPGSDGYKNQQTPRSNVSKAPHNVTLDVSEHSKARWVSSIAGDKVLPSVMQSRPIRCPTRRRSKSACSA